MGTGMTAAGLRRKGKTVRWLKYLGIALMAAVMLLAMFLLFAPRLGWQIDAVESGSMSPALQVGSAVVTREVAPSDVKVDDIITYRSPWNGQLTTHRVVGIEEGQSLAFQTKGDANEDPDPYLVPAANLEGRVVLTLPWLGSVADFVKTPLGFGLMLGLPGLAIIFLEWRGMMSQLSKEEKRSKAGVKADGQAGG